MPVTKILTYHLTITGAKVVVVELLINLRDLAVLSKLRISFRAPRASFKVSELLALHIIYRPWRQMSRLTSADPFIHRKGHPGAVKHLPILGAMRMAVVPLADRCCDQIQGQVRPCAVLCASPERRCNCDSHFLPIHHTRFTSLRRVSLSRSRVILVLVSRPRSVGQVTLP